MAAAATSSTLPYSSSSSSSQQLPGQAIASTAIPEAVSSTGWHNSPQSGSIGPFFAVVSVIAVLTIASCVIGRAYSRRQANADPLDSIIKRRSCGEWMKDSWSFLRGSRRLGSSFKVSMFRKEQRVVGATDDEDILDI